MAGDNLYHLTLTNAQVQELKDLLEQIEVTPTGDDAGVKFLGQIEVMEEVVAGSDSYPVLIAFHCDIANTTGKTITGATDVTQILQSDSDSATGLFNGTTAGKYLLIGGIDIFEGVKMKFDSLATVEPDNVKTEAYVNDTAGWSGVSYMAANAEFPYQSDGYNFAQHLVEHMFVGFDPISRGAPSSWEAATFNINGTDYTYRWARIRIDSAITGDPQLQQLKLHTDRIEVEPYGIFKYGKARSIIELSFDRVKNSTKDPADEGVAYTSNFTAAETDNEFANNTEDGFGLLIRRKPELDTSVPLIIAIACYVKGTAIGDIELQYEVSQILDGFIYDGAEPFDSYSKITTISESQNLKKFTILLTCDINKLNIQSGIAVNLYRDAQVANTNDTLEASIVITNIGVFGYSWKV